ncbi:MAG: SEC-C domain-containing protein [Proteobacteria bacterium]|nr:SEC-C domain-containing protein [Pseudomonadota bacterium]
MIDRNQPCPCGSGKRYKHCHGSLSGPPSGVLAEALAAYRAGALRRAESLYRQAIAEHPDDVDALNGLSAVLFERLRYGEALGPFRDAAERTGWAVAFHRKNLGLALAKLLEPEANERRGLLVAQYYERERVRKAAPARPATVSAVLVARGPLESVLRSIESVAAQHVRVDELVVVAEGRGEHIAPQAAGVASHVSIIDAPLASEQPVSPDVCYAHGANLGAAGAQGEFLAFLDAGDRFEADSIGRMVAEVAGGGADAWGFAQVEYDASRHRADAERAMATSDAPGEAAIGPQGPVETDARVWDAPVGELPSFVLGRRDLAGANGNLFIARSLFRKLGGYREADHPGWDLCVRASRIAEPVIVEQRLYHVGGFDSGRVTRGLEPETRQLIERRRDAFLADALGSDAPTTNEFAPSFPANRTLLLQSEFRAERGDHVPIAVLRSLTEEWLRRIALRASGTVARAADESAGHPVPGDALVVLGVYRSGTSALTRVLNLCGAKLPGNLMAARLDFNRKGFWESEAIVDLDARLLKRLGAEWDTPDVTVPRDGVIADEFVATTMEVLAGEFDGAGFILIKDPRVCVLAPLWHRALVASGYRPAYVVSLRHPLEVAGSFARSLRSYGGLALPRGLALWRGYMERVEAFVEETDARIVHVRYSDLLDDWRRVVARIAHRLGVALDARVHAGEIDRFVERDMRSQRVEAGSLAAIVGEAEAAAIDALYQRFVVRCERDATETRAT